jgi:hypothetical protein
MALQRTRGGAGAGRGLYDHFGRRMGSERTKLLKRVVEHVEEARAVERRGLQGREVSFWVGGWCDAGCGGVVDLMYGNADNVWW